MVEILYTKFDTNKTPSKLIQFETGLPQAMQIKLQKFVKWQDRYSGILGKMLLLNGLLTKGYGSDILNDIHIDSSGKPSLPNGPFFNISHSGEYVLCAFNNECKIGIDIEKKEAVKIEDFETVFTEHELKKIKSNYKDSSTFFFDIWCAKEAVSKAEGSGLHIDFKTIFLNDKQAIYNNKKWHLNNIYIDDFYVSWIATETIPNEILVKKIVF